MPTQPRRDVGVREAPVERLLPLAGRRGGGGDDESDGTGDAFERNRFTGSETAEALA